MSPSSRSAAIIGLDVGTTGVKAVAFRPCTQQRVEALREYPLLSPAPGWAVQELPAVIAAASDALAECARGIGPAFGPAEVSAVSLSAAMHGLVGLAADGTPMTPLVTWADGRASQEAIEVRGSPEGEILRATTGAPLHPMTPLAKLRWYSRHEPDIWRSARWWAGLKDYLIFWLTGTMATELSSASGTGLLDVAHERWSPTALALCGLDETRLPPILSPTATLPLAEPAAGSVGLPVGTPVVVGAADGPLANLGTGAIEPGVAALSLGTSGAVRTTIGAPHLDGSGALFCYALTEKAWVVGGAISNGADVVRWAGQALLPDRVAQAGPSGRDAAVLETAAGVPPGSDGLVMLPFLLPERAPIWNPGVRASYLGLRRSHTRAHMVRAAVEGVCLQMADILERVAAVEPVTSVRATGRAFQSELWRVVMAAAAGRPFHVVDGSEGTALGAAALGLHALDPSVGLGDALRLLGFPAALPAPVEAPADVVAALEGVRAARPALIEALGGVVGGAVGGAQGGAVRGAAGGR